MPKPKIKEFRIRDVIYQCNLKYPLIISILFIIVRQKTPKKQRKHITDVLIIVVIQLHSICLFGTLYGIINLELLPSS